MMRWNSSDKFILLSTIMFDLGYNSGKKGAATLCASSFMVETTRTSTLPSEGLLMINIKRKYRCHELAADHFCSRSVTGTNPVNSYLSFSCCYFEVDMSINYKKCIWRMFLHMDTFVLLLYVSLLKFHLLQFLVTTNIFVWLWIHTFELVGYLILWCWNPICCVISHKSSLGMLHPTRLLKDIPTYIYLLKNW